MTATSVLGQRTKTTMATGRDRRAARLADQDRRPDRASSTAPSTSRAARCTRRRPSSGRKQCLRDAFRAQLDGQGFSFVEILTMCPTDWYVEPTETPRLGRGELHADLPAARPEAALSASDRPCVRPPMWAKVRRNGGSAPARSGREPQSPESLRTPARRAGCRAGGRVRAGSYGLLPRHQPQRPRRERQPGLRFRYSLNPYRGCEHGCVYCLRAPHARVPGLLAPGSTSSAASW